MVKKRKRGPEDTELSQVKQPRSTIASGPLLPSARVLAKADSGHGALFTPTVDVSTVVASSDDLPVGNCITALGGLDAPLYQPDVNHMLNFLDINWMENCFDTQVYPPTA